MSFLSFLFGGPGDTSNAYKGQEEDLAKQMQNYDPGLGFVGRAAKGMLKRGLNDPYSLPGVQLAKSQGATNWAGLQRQLQMSSAMMPGEQSGLTAGILSKGYLQNQDQTGQAVLGAYGSDIKQFSDIFNLARGQRIGAEMAGMQGAGQIYGNLANQQFQRQQLAGQKPGLFQMLGQVANLASAFVPGLGGHSGSHGSVPMGVDYS